MTDEAAFLDAIRVDPDDDTARLVYADWLDERGDPRGEFIRLQEEMKPLEVFSDRYDELKPRRNVLRSQIEPTWIERLGYQPVYGPLFSELPDDREHRWRLIDEFIDLWHEPSDTDRQLPESEITGLSSAERRLGTPLPEALYEWYVRFGGLRKLWSRQDEWISASKLRIDPEYDALIFRAENQGVVLWGIDRIHLDDGHPDPPVSVYRDWTGIESPTVSAFAAFTLMLESMSYAPVSAYGEHYDNEFQNWLRELDEILIPCDLPRRYWALEEVTIYEGVDIFTVASHADNYLYVAARNGEAFAQLSEELRGTLERTDWTGMVAQESERQGD